MKKKIVKILSKVQKKMHIEKLKIYKKNVINSTSGQTILTILINALSSGHLQVVNAFDKAFTNTF